MRVKICGITNEEDALFACTAGADFLGFIFYPPSPRYVTPSKAKEIIQTVQAWCTRENLARPGFVGVFVNESAARVSELLVLAGLDYAQLHGEETPALFEPLAGRAFKALRPRDEDAALAQALIFAPLGPPTGPQLLIDAYDTESYGGTGKRADWGVAADLARRVPRLLLAGGLNPENVAKAVQVVRPWGVDVSS
ncbi:MAG: phosphoribosylanthranilate isomerase, partial [Caldilineae bacterium]